MFACVSAWSRSTARPFTPPLWRSRRGSCPSRSAPVWCAARWVFFFGALGRFAASFGGKPEHPVGGRLGVAAGAGRERTAVFEQAVGIGDHVLPIAALGKRSGLALDHD